MSVIASTNYVSCPEVHSITTGNAKQNDTIR